MNKDFLKLAEQLNKTEKLTSLAVIEQVKKLTKLTEETRSEFESVISAYDILKKYYEGMPLEKEISKISDTIEDNLNKVHEKTEATDKEIKSIVSSVDKLFKEIARVEKMKPKELTQTIIERIQEIPLELSKEKKDELIAETQTEENISKVVDGINNLPITPEQQIDAKHIKNLPDIDGRIRSIGVSNKYLSQLLDVDLSGLDYVGGKYVLGSGTGGGGEMFIDQTPDNGTYDLLIGDVDGVNTTFTVSQGEYPTGKLVVALNGQIMEQGATEDFVETTPASGIFDFVTAPNPGDVITAFYSTGTGGGGGASAFTDLTDVPSSYTGQAGKVPVVNGTEDGLDFTSLSGGGDMLASTYDPANGARQVAFNDELPDVSTLVPYTGATTDVDLGTFTLFTPRVEGTALSGLTLASPNDITIVGNGNINIDTENTGSYVRLTTTGLTGSHDINFPDQAGTIALTSDITGGTPGGSDSEFQFNDGGVFNGSSVLSTPDAGANIDALADKFFFKDGTDQTKRFRFNSASITTATDRTITIPDQTGTMALTSDLATKLGTALTSANIFVGNGSNVATGVAMSGDATLANTGALTIANDAVTFAKFQNITDNRLLGRSAGSNGDMQEITIGAGLTLSSGALVNNTTQSIQFYRATSTLTNMPSGLQWFVSDTQFNLRNSVIDLSQASQVRLLTFVTTAGSASSKIIARYKISGFSSDKNDYSVLGDSSTEISNSLATGGDIWVDSGWVNITSAAKTDTTYVGLFTINGNGAADPVTQQTIFMFR